MNHLKEELAARRRRSLGVWALAAIALGGCSATIGDNQNSRGTNGGGGKLVDPVTGKVIECEGNEVTNAKRLIRLSFNQIASSVGSLLGTAFRDQIVTTYQVPDPTTRW